MKENMVKHDKVILIRLMRSFIEETDESHWLDINEINNRLRKYMESENKELFKDGFELK